MKKTIILLSLIACTYTLHAQNMTIEKLLQLGRVSPLGITKDKKAVVYSVRTYDASENKPIVKKYSIPIIGGNATEIHNTKELLDDNVHTSADGKYTVVSKEVKVKKITGADYYPEKTTSDVLIIDDLNYRHWDTWEDGYFGHVILYTLKDNKVIDSVDVMLNEPYDCPQKPFGGEEDFLISPDGKQVLYVTKKKYGKEYALSTNTDIYAYDIATKQTNNITEGMMGYDINPSFSSKGVLAFLSMKEDGNEAAKNDIIVMNGDVKINLTAAWDGTVNSFLWSNDGSKIYFIAATDGTQQLFEVDYPGLTKKMPLVKQITYGNFDINSLVGQADNTLVLTRTDMNHANEIYTLDIKNNLLKQLTSVNDAAYNTVKLSRTEKRYMTTTDGKKMLVWVIYPPDFDPNKKYPTLLYCQGGPQSALTQFYSFRWNFQLMAANGYIIVAPNRRGMPGHGVQWNAEISKDYGGQVMKDYLTAIDEMAKESFVDKERLGCIGASFGGYSAFYLAGIHNKRFKTFIAHDGIFDWRAMYGTTEEMFFVNHDLGGAYWDNDPTTQKSYNEFNPVNHVKKWDAPILIIQGGKDYRVPPGQGLAAFQAAQLLGIKSKLLYFPNENHWVLKDQNAFIWQSEFFKWLKETL
ncbi:MAG: S9 family peptidase [Chitinophagaceae bacterium]|nr:S9 family peptidase [Chitinophagaceae bacterium]MCW5906107.1 S9 family peptidase [Chitinophagaceae bacterium]